MSDARVRYTKSEDRWWRTEWKPRCQHYVLVHSRPCQGTEGHEGPHWCYSESGGLCQHDADGLRFTPPSHKHYLSPIDMGQRYWRNFYDSQEVVDPETIAMLERGDVPEPDASVIRPVVEL